MGIGSKKLWIRTSFALQIVTGMIHALSLVSSPKPQNETEERLFKLITTYRSDLGAGFDPTFSELFTALSACFTLLCLFGGINLAYLLRKDINAVTMNGVLNINLIVFGACFVIMAVFTFLPPIVLTGLIVLALAAARLVASKPAKADQPDLS